LRPGIAFASAIGVSQNLSTSMAPLTTVMWRMRRADGLRAHATVGVQGGSPAVTWYVNERPVGSKAFDDWTEALRWCEQLEAQNWAVGWRRIHAEDDRRSAQPPAGR
jgi:hypothetical protein